jgi:Flp pilus assembly pilin Flp
MELRDPFTHRESERGQAMVEYSIILALVSIAAIVVLGEIGSEVAGLLNTVHNAFGGA